MTAYAIYHRSRFAISKVPKFRAPQSRGFEGSIVQNVRLDGLNYIGTSAIDCENLRGVEVLNGLAGALYGPESPSGVFNYLLKHPTDQSFFTYREDYDSQSIFTEQIDAVAASAKTVALATASISSMAPAKVMSMTARQIARSAVSISTIVSTIIPTSKAITAITRRTSPACPANRLRQQPDE